MAIEFKGVIKKDDEFIVKTALNHYRERLLYFKGNESVKRLGLGAEVGSDVDNEIHQIDELLKYMLPDREYFGFDKHKKLGLYLTVVASSLRQYSADLIEMRRQIKGELPEAELNLASIEDALDEVERVLTEYPVLRTRGRIKVGT